ncbi:MCE family protein [Allokutzneria sp. A3M-2-11 16]|uniref:MCE family protein n=1 Tax=Allokutzneria sp. A3M-2-11 16 TaxID=2962043 RepID=UPI0020B76BB3|nr:MCE family protein [Allokutzneria sp. A3M-2-11 16]MCP3803867.1 MCE family protein [Allokutzneria sp. A3M-2-11 16]
MFQRLLGLVLLIVLVAVPALTVAVYRDAFTTSVTVTLRTDHTGNQLSVASDVKVNGLLVGEVRRVSSRGDGAELELALHPDKSIPRDSTARLLPKTLFGERYVALRPGTGAPLLEGDVIGQDRSSSAIELEQVLAGVMPTLRALQPQKLAVTLSAISQALQGRGAQLGRTLVQLDAYLKQLNPHLPEFTDGLGKLAEVSTVYSEAAPDLLEALRELTVTSTTLVEQKANNDALFRSVTTASNDFATFLDRNERNLIRLAAASRPPLELFGQYSPSFPCTLETLVKLKPVLDKAFGKGTVKPGLRVSVRPASSRGAYVPGKDTPRYDAKGGPKCYPFGQSRFVPISADGDLGVPNSPQERDVVAVLVAPSLGVTPSEVPNWSSVLLGPMLRGTEVAVG